jgi:hypothetical protein
LFEGKIMGILPGDEANTERLGMMMAGLKAEEAV